MPSASGSAPCCPERRRARTGAAPGVLGLALLAAVAGCAESSRSPAPSPAVGLRVAFDEQGAPRPESAAVLEQVRDGAAAATDVVVFSHGWWNSPETAECRYRQMIEGMQASRPSGLADPDFRPLVIGLYWPSAVFPLAAGDCEAAGDLREHGGTAPRGEALRARLEAWGRAAFPAAATRPEFPAEVSRLAALAEREESGARLTTAEGTELVAILVTWRDAGRPSSERTAPPDVPGEPRFDEPPPALAARWARAHPAPGGPRAGEAGGAGPALAPSGGRWLDWANAFTVWTMKDRAGIVGSRGGYDLLRLLQPHRARGLRIHLVGHSFGGKLLSAAITGHGREPANVVDSFVILQGAFSHFAFSTADQIRALQVSTERPGLYVDVVGAEGVRGPLVVTLSAFDTPNQVLYPLAFALVGDMLEADQVPRFGSLGAHGIQGPAVQRMTLAGERLAARLAPGAPRLVTVDATHVIRGHGDFVKPEVFALIWDAIVAGRQASP